MSSKGVVANVVTVVVAVAVLVCFVLFYPTILEEKAKNRIPELL